ncbi:MAG: hypothetical protein ACRETX_12800 [Steroidobacteraceae bacterium]
MPRHGAIEFVVHPPIVTVRILSTDDGHVIGTAQIQTQRGPLTFTATADGRQLHAAIARAISWYMRRTGKRMPSAAAGAFGDWTADMARKVAKARVIGKLLDEAKAVAKNPQIARAVGLSTVVVPGEGSAVIALHSASELLQGLRRKDAQAVQAWRAMNAQAQLGNLKARRAVHVVHAVARAPRIIAHHQ